MRCAVFGCKRDNQRKDFHGEVQFFSFPKNKSTRKLWVLACGRPDEFKPENARICSEHFGPDDFIRNLMHELLNYRPKTYRPLKSDAVPSIGLPKRKGRKSKPNKILEERETKKRNKELVEQLLKESYIEQNSTEKSIEEERHKELMGRIFKDCNIKQEPTTNADNIVEESCLSTSTSSVGTNTDGSHSTVFVELDNLRKQNVALLKENYFLKQEQTAFTKFFSKHQIKKLTFPHVRVKWNDEEIVDAVALHSAGPNAYRMLLSKGYPFPAESTLRSWKRKLNSLDVRDEM